ncbi:AAA family ATPase [Marinomonas sp.]|uniref:AAA family ATPase n=1 Tax=Marinomonas sp. TaxID=1904862 RepID=UPI003BAAB495
MPTIHSFPYNSSQIPLVINDGKKLNTTKNIYSIITGINGVGKSRFLENMLISKKIKSKKIAISTSPFSRFSNKEFKKLSNSHIIADSSSLSNSIINGVLYNFKSNNSASNIFPLLRELNFSPYIKFNIKLKFSLDKGPLENHKNIRIEKKLYANLKEKNYNYLNELYELYDLYDPDNLDDLDELDKLDELENFKKSKALKKLPPKKLKNIFHNAKNLIDNIIKDSNCEVIIHEGGQSITELNSQTTHQININIINSLITLINYDLIELSNLYLRKNKKNFLYNDASSGEKCFLAMLIGIGSYIENDSIILIDEPEISLHPEWQESFIPMLIKTFSHYEKCHFIIATHSPQIVSNLEENNCYVIKLSTREIICGRDLNHKSADYQLTEVFGSPGHMNEYLSRICFNLLAKLKTHKKFEEDDKTEFEHLVLLKEKINNDDPILDLILVLEEVVQHYASNK